MSMLPQSRFRDADADQHAQTSLDKTGSDAMNAAGDYSAAYCIICTDSDYSGHGMVCTASQPTAYLTVS